MEECKKIITPELILKARETKSVMDAVIIGEGLYSAFGLMYHIQNRRLAKGLEEGGRPYKFDFIAYSTEHFVLEQIMKEIEKNVDLRWKGISLHICPVNHSLDEDLNIDTFNDYEELYGVSAYINWTVHQDLEQSPQLGF